MLRTSHSNNSNNNNNNNIHDNHGNVSRCHDSSNSSSKSTNIISSISVMNSERNVMGVGPNIQSIEVISPATLSEGYEFIAEIGGESFPVVVPPGGVQSGQRFTTKIIPPLTKPMDESGHGSNISAFTISVSDTKEGKGQWKDGLFSCFRYGIFHPHVWNAWFCPQLLIGQIITRMKLTTWPFDSHTNNNNNNSKKGSKSRNPMQKIIFFMVALNIYDAWMAPPMFEFTIDKKGGFLLPSLEQHHHQQQQMLLQQNPYNQHYNDDGNFFKNSTVLFHQLVYVLLTLPMSIYGIWTVMKLRAAIRAKFGIPTGRLGRWEDFWYTICCNCCMLSQMARQTADYDDELASCCSTNGIYNSSNNNSSNNNCNIPFHRQHRHHRSTTTTTTTITLPCCTNTTTNSITPTKSKRMPPPPPYNSSSSFSSVTSTTSTATTNSCSSSDSDTSNNAAVTTASAGQDETMKIFDPITYNNNV